MKKSDLPPASRQDSYGRSLHDHAGGPPKASRRSPQTEGSPSETYPFSKPPQRAEGPGPIMWYDPSDDEMKALTQETFDALHAALAKLALRQEALREFPYQLWKARGWVPIPSAQLFMELGRLAVKEFEIPLSSPGDSYIE